MTEKVFKKTRRNWILDGDIQLTLIITYAGDFFYPYKDTVEWNEEIISFDYPEQYDTEQGIDVRIWHIAIHRKDIQHIFMYKNGLWTHRRCKRPSYN